MSKKIPLEEWAKLHYDPPPSLWTLRRWARDGEFRPAAEKVGKTYYVHQNARRIGVDEPAGGSLVERLQAAAT